MLFLGHIGIVAFVSSMIFLPILGGVIGVLLPDLVDKGLFVVHVAPCSRFIAHSIFFFPVVGIIAYLITRNKQLAIAVALGSVLHLLQDMHDDVPFLYPLKTYAFFSTCGKQITVTFTPFVITTEIIGGLLLLFMGLFRPKFLHIRKKLWNYLRNLGLVR